MKILDARQASALYGFEVPQQHALPRTRACRPLCQVHTTAWKEHCPGYKSIPPFRNERKKLNEMCDMSSYLIIMHSVLMTMANSTLNPSKSQDHIHLSLGVQHDLAISGLVLLEPSGLAVQNAEWQVGTLLSLSPW
jgi:hypothetical protein